MAGKYPGEVGDLVAKLRLAVHNILADVDIVLPGIFQCVQGKAPGYPTIRDSPPDRFAEVAHILQFVQVRLINVQ